MFCSDVKHLGSGDSTQEVERNTRLRLVFLPTLLSCYRRFLGDLQQNRAQSRLLYLLIKILSYGWQSIRLKSSNRLGISSRHGKTIPKGDNTWEKGTLICICVGKTMSKLMRVLRAIATMN